MSDKIIHVTDKSFEHNILNSEVPVLVDFWAEWCGPCKAIAPLLDELADEYAGKIMIAKVDVSANQEAAAKYGVRNIPCLMVFKAGKHVATKVGSVPKAQIKEFIDSSL